jgi:hypothetical protein
MQSTTVNLPIGPLLGVGVLAMNLVSPAWVLLAEASPAPATSNSSIEAEVYTSARTCGECHADIYNSWKNSLHAFSMTDPIFDAAYMQALKVGGDEARRLCLQCHAPMAVENGDTDQLRSALALRIEGASRTSGRLQVDVVVENVGSGHMVPTGMPSREVVLSSSMIRRMQGYQACH